MALRSANLILECRGIGNDYPRPLRIGGLYAKHKNCEEVLLYLKQHSLRSGSTYGDLIETALEQELADVIQAALSGLPTALRDRDQLEDCLDYGSDKLLHALVLCEPFWVEDEELRSAVLMILGEYLPEMTTSARNQMCTTLFARALARMEPGAMGEFDLAKMILTYLEANGSNDDTISAFLSAVDFSVIANDALRYSILPRVEPLNMALAFHIHDTMMQAAPIQTRCVFSARLLRPHYESFGRDKIYELPCGRLVYSKCMGCIPTERARGSRSNTKVCRCPICPNHHDAPSKGQLQQSQFFSDSMRRLYYYRERKALRAKALDRWADEAAPDHEITREGSATQNHSSSLERKRKRRNFESILSSDDSSLFVRILDQCSPLGADRVVVLEVDSPSDSVEEAILTFEEHSFLGADVVYDRSRALTHILDRHGVLHGVRRELSWEENGIDLQGCRDGDYDLIVKRAQSVG